MLPQRGIVPFVPLFHTFLEAESLFLRPNALAHLLQDVREGRTLLFVFHR